MIKNIAQHYSRDRRNIPRQKDLRTAMSITIKAHLLNLTIPSRSHASRKQKKDSEYAKLRHIPEVTSILLVTADAKDARGLRCGEKKRSLEETLRRTEFQGCFEVRELPSCRPQDLRSALLPQTQNYSFQWA